MVTRHFSFLLMCFFVLSGCGKHPEESKKSNKYSNSKSSLYFKSTQRVVIEVYYEPGAEPFTGTTISGVSYWKILEDNLTAIFQFRSSIPVLVIPKELSDMQALPLQKRTQWTTDQILALNEVYKQKPSTKTEARFYFYFLKGQSSDGAGVIGLSVNETPVLAIFKDVVSSSGNYLVQRYVEQSTLVHEMGHALGFVNNGIPMKTPHQDTAHGTHTTNSNCVMYWANEGASDLAAFVSNFISSGSTVMWGPEVLADAQEFSK